MAIGRTYQIGWIMWILVVISFIPDIWRMSMKQVSYRYLLYILSRYYYELERLWGWVDVWPYFFTQNGWTNLVEIHPTVYKRNQHNTFFFIKSTPIKSQTEASTSIIKTDHKMRTETAGMKRNQQRFEIIGHTMLGISPFSRLSRNKDTMKVSVQAQAIMRKVDWGS